MKITVESLAAMRRDLEREAARYDVSEAGEIQAPISIRDLFMLIDALDDAAMLLDCADDVVAMGELIRSMRTTINVVRELAQKTSGLTIGDVDNLNAIIAMTHQDRTFPERST